MAQGRGGTDKEVDYAEWEGTNFVLRGFQTGYATFITRTTGEKVLASSQMLPIAV